MGELGPPDLRTTWACVLAGVICLSGLGGASARAATADEIADGCPTAAQIAQINADFTISFEGDPTAPTLVCTAADGSADLTRMKERFYDALLVMREMSFARPLPWTSKPLYEWLNDAIAGIRLRTDIANTSCCSPANTINLRAQSVNWNEPGFDGISIVHDLLAHEGRHAEGFPHTCMSNDQTLGEKGGWYTHYKIREWRGLFGGSFLDGPTEPSAYRVPSLVSAKGIHDRFCSFPTADVGVTVTAPYEVVAGSQLAYSASLTNHGPDAAPETYLSQDPSPGLQFVSAQSDLGDCLSPQQTAGGPVVCEIGTLAAGATVNATFTYNVDVSAGPVFGKSSLGGVYSIADALDPVADNDDQTPLVGVVSPSTTVDTNGRAKTRRTGRGFTVKPGVFVGCPTGTATCTGTAVATASGGQKSRRERVIAQTPLSIAPGAEIALSMKLNRVGARLLRERRRLRATLTLATQVGSAPEDSATKSFRVRLP